MDSGSAQDTLGRCCALELITCPRQPKTRYPLSILMTRTTLWWGAVLVATVIIVAHFWLLPSSPSRSRRAAHTQGRESVRVPVFCVGGPADVRRALSVLKLALDRHRTELSNRMRLIDGMLSVALPHCVAREEMRHVVKAVRLKEWKELNRTPEAWQVNDDLLHSLLRQPPFVPALSNTADVSRHDITGRHSDDNHTTATFTADRHSSHAEASSSSPPDHGPDNEPTFSYDEVSQVFVHLQRDWTPDGAELRHKTYGPLLKEVAQHVSQQGASILVPGCGLGRLAFELSMGGMGHKVTAVDVSASMVAATHAVLTWPGSEGTVFYPYVADPLTNSVSHACPRFYQSVFSAPSVHTAPVTGHLALELGDFTRLAMNPAWSSAYDCVVTCFFIDTAVNVLDYMWAIHRVLKPGGIWINSGPLHYHHPVKKGAVHLSLEGLLEGARVMGLEPEGVNGGQEKGTILEECPYRPEPRDCQGLRVERYRPVLFRARKAL